MAPKLFVTLVLVILVIHCVNCRPDPDCGQNHDGGGNPSEGGNPNGGGGGDHEKEGGKHGGGGSGKKGGGGGGGGGEGGSGGGSGGLEVVISFDSLDANSKNFFSKALKPIYEEMSKCVKWHFIPCSTSHIVQDVLQCKDGVEECKIDALHACAAHYYENDEQSLGKFFLCMMASDDQMCAAQKCATSSGLDWNKLKGCKPCNEAGEWCDNRFKQLNMLHEPNIPGVLFDMKYNAQSEQQAMSDLKAAICDQLKKKNAQCAACGSCSGDGSSGGGGGGSGGGGSHGGGSPGGGGSHGGNSLGSGSPGGGSPGGGNHGGGGHHSGDGNCPPSNDSPPSGVGGQPSPTIGDQQPHMYSADGGGNVPGPGTIIDAQGNVLATV